MATGTNMKKFATWPLMIQRIFQTSARFLFARLIEPLSKDEDSRRHEFILNILLLTSITLSFVCTVVVLLDIHRAGNHYDGIAWWAVTLIFCIFSILYACSRAGYFKISAYILIGVYTVPVAWMTHKWGLDLPQGLLMYALLITMSSVLIGTRVALIFTSLMSSYFFILTVASANGRWIPDTEWRAAPFVPLDGIVFIVTFMAISTVSWLSNREIEKSLFRARTSERALTQERDNLEIKIEERTTELKNAQAEKMAQLQRFVEFGRLASGLFHDLANPLTSVALNLESLQDQSGTTERAKLHLQQALQSTKGLEQFIQAARKQLQMQETLHVFAIHKEIEDVLAILHHKSVRLGIEIECQTPTVSPTLYGNPLKFHQIVANLLSNALDAYTDLNSQHRPITLSVIDTMNTLTLCVTDHGCGISVSQQPKIFTPFYSTKGIDSGLGIGLSSTKNIVEKDFHGTISFASVPGRGTSFTVHLPHTPPPRT